MWCINCGKDYGPGEFCPDCGAAGTAVPAPRWGRQALAGALLDRWPRDERGEIIEPVFLVHRTALDMADTMTVNLLEAYGIPALRQYPNDGSFGTVIMGMAASGTDIFVPETMREEALSLLEGENEQ
jgi:hypothetical protein